MGTIAYPFEMKPLSDEKGGGWLIIFPDLPGCMSDGETPEEAIKNGQDALECWIQACTEAGKEIPLPGKSSGSRFSPRIPRSLHARLVSRAEQEGVSMNTLVSSFLAECLGRREVKSGSALIEPFASGARKQR
jgi:antitoxin HicB